MVLQTVILLQFHKFLFPLLGGIMLLVFFIQTTYDSMDPHHGSGSEIGGVELVFCLSVAILLLGIYVMVYQRCLRPAFFKDISLPSVWTSPMMFKDLLLISRLPNFWLPIRVIPSLVIEASSSYLEKSTSKIEERRVGKECRSRWSPYH